MKPESYKVFEELGPRFFSYDPETGMFTRLARDPSFFRSKRAFTTWMKRCAEREVTAKNGHGYIRPRMSRHGNGSRSGHRGPVCGQDAL